MTPWMLTPEEVQDAKKIKLSSTDNENFLLILHIIPLINEN